MERYIVYSSGKLLGLRDIYCRLMDEESREIFEARLDFMFDRNSDDFIKRISPYLHDLELTEVAVKLESSKAKGIIIFGSGHDGILTRKILKMCGYSVDYFCDSNKNKVGSRLEGIPILAVSDIVKNYKGYLIIIGSRKYSAEMV